MIQLKFCVLFIFILSICHTAFSNESQPYANTIDSLISRLEMSENIERFSILLELSEKTRRINANQAESYMLEAKEFIDESTVNQNVFDFYKHMSGVKLSQNHFEEALALSDKAIQLQFVDLDLKDHIDVYQFMGTAYSFLGENDKAQEVFFSGLRIADSLNIETLKPSIYNSIGMVYIAMNDTIMSEKYLLLAIDRAREVSNQNELVMAQGNLAILYTNQKRYTDAEKLILETIEIIIKGGGGSALGSNYNNLGAIYHEQKKHKKSLEYLQKGLDIAEQYQHPSSIALGYINTSEAYMELENYDLAKERIEIGLQMVNEINNNGYKVYGLLAASKIYERSGEHIKALSYYKKYTELNDSLLNESRINAVVELEEKYESEKKEKEIQALSDDKVSAEKRERTLVQTICLLCFSLITLGGLFYFLRQNHIKNSIIQKKNLKIASDKIQLLEKGKEIIALESLVKGQENERQRLAKEMHDGLGGLLAISHSKLTNLGEPEINANVVLREARNLIGDAYDQVRQISHNLMPLDLEKFGLVPALTNMIQRIEKQDEVKIDFRTYQFDLLLNNELGLNIYRIAQEALTNILKSAKAQNILIELIQHEETISLSIEDDGIGFDTNAKVSGIGIRNMRNRTELLNGEFSIESKILEGTSISVVLPNLSEQPIPFSESSKTSFA